MNHRGTLAAVALVAGFSLFGCTRTVYVDTEPPPPQAEVRPASPAPNAVWIDGHWNWRGGRYVWVPGHWDRNPKGSWVAGHWDKRGRRWVWVPGHWRR